MIQVRLHSEPYSADGNLAADGAQRLLGQPNLSPLELVLRETLQNSWDASLDCPGRPLFRVRIRRLAPGQQEAMREFFRELPPPEANEPVRERIQRFLESPDPVVMEICDEGTAGLGGPTSASEAFPEGVQPDFVNFVRNIGSPRDIAFGGGTYGFGKSSLFRFSRCDTVIIHTLTGDGDTPEHRLIAKSMGSAFQHGGLRYTGRHWWGAATGEPGTSVDPLLAEEGSVVAGSLGLPERAGREQKGTSLMILDPDLEDLDGGTERYGDDGLRNRLMARLQETLLWHGWPKFTALPSGEAPMSCHLSVMEREEPMPDPATIMPLRLLTEALADARMQKNPVTWYRSTYIGFIGDRSAPVDGIPADDRFRRHLRETSIIPEQLCHMALLRPAELIVRYEVGSINEAKGEQWAGVFICNTGDDNEIEHAFALSEPPAHNDWEPAAAQSLTSRQRSYVKVALKRIKERLRELSGADLSRANAQGPPGRISVAELASDIGSHLLGSGPGASDGTRNPPPLRNGVRRPVRISTPEALGTVLMDGAPITSFSLRVSGDSDEEVSLLLSPWVQSDVREREMVAPNGIAPRIVGILIDDVPVDRPGDQVRCRASAGGTNLRVMVSVPDYVAVGLTADLDRPDSP